MPLIDVLKEAIPRSNCHTTIGSMFGEPEIYGEGIETIAI